MSTNHYRGHTLHAAFVISVETSGAAIVNIPGLSGMSGVKVFPSDAEGTFAAPSPGDKAFVAVSPDLAHVQWVSSPQIITNEIETGLVGPQQIKVKNTSGGTLTKGTPVYATGSVGASGAVEVQASDASIASTMPALGLLEHDLNGDVEGHATIMGVIGDIDTSPYVINDELYVAPGGGLTVTRPTSSTDLVQKIGRVVRDHAQTGEVLVLGAGRTNDTPNTITVDDGSAATPAVGFGNAPGTGMYHNSPDVIAFSIGGTEELAFNNSTFFFKNNNLSEIGDLAATGTISQNGTAVSLSGHTHSYAPLIHTHSYLSTAGGTISGSLTTTGNTIVEGDLFVGKNGGSDSHMHFYDDNNNAWRSFFWDDSANDWRIEDNNGATQTLYHSGNSHTHTLDSATSKRQNNNPISVDGGSTGDCDLQHYNDADTGIHFSGANEVQIVCGGSPVAGFTTTTVNMQEVYDSAASGTTYYVSVNSAGRLFRTTNQATSARKYKENIQDLPLSEAYKVLDLPSAVTYTMKERPSDAPDVEVGRIADDAVGICDSLVVYDEEGEVLSYRYEREIVLLTEVVKDMHDRLKALEA